MATGPSGAHAHHGRMPGRRRAGHGGVVHVPERQALARHAAEAPQLERRAVSSPCRRPAPRAVSASASATSSSRRASSAAARASSSRARRAVAGGPGPARGGGAHRGVELRRRGGDERVAGGRVDGLAGAGIEGLQDSHGEV
jgi:hypothetical protein